MNYILFYNPIFSSSLELSSFFLIFFFSASLSITTDLHVASEFPLLSLALSRFLAICATSAVFFCFSLFLLFSFSNPFLYSRGRHHRVANQHLYDDDDNDDDDDDGDDGDDDDEDDGEHNDHDDHQVIPTTIPHYSAAINTQQWTGTNKLGAFPDVEARALSNARADSLPFRRTAPRKRGTTTLVVLPAIPSSRRPREERAFTEFAFGTARLWTATAPRMSITRNEIEKIETCQMTNFFDTKHLRRMFIYNRKTGE